MAIEILEVSEVTEEQRIQREAILREFIADEFPDVDVSLGGVFNQRTVLPNALLNAIANDNFTRLKQSQSLRLIEQNPDIAEPDIVDNVLSNFLIERQAGDTATGKVIVVIESKTTTVIAAGAILRVGELTYETTKSFTGVTDPALVLSDADRLIQARLDGTFSFVIDVEATAVGEQFRIQQNTQLVFDAPPPGLIDAFADSDFTGGFSEQSNQDLIDQLASGVSTKVLAGRANIESVILESFPRTQHQSLVGFGDAEMVRDRNNIFATSHGGKADIYAATDIRPEVETFTVEATLVDADTKTLQISIGKDVKPGFYGVTRVVNAGDDPFGGLEIVSVVRGVDTTGEGFIPELPEVFHGAFSAFQTAEVRFIDPAFDPAGGNTGSYDLSLLGLPDVDEVQDLLVNRDRRNPNADYLFKAAVPMLSGVSLVIDKLASELSDADALSTLELAIQEAVATRVNAIGFSLGQLPASLVIAAASSVLTGNSSVRTPVELSATLIRPDGVSQPFFSNDKIIVPDDPQNGISQRTVLFFLDPQDVVVSFNDVGVIEV